MNEKRKIKKKSLIFGIIAVLLAAALVILPFALEKKQDREESTASILSGRAEERTISVYLSGTGTIASEDAVKITIPQGVEITEYLLENGDSVTAGEPVAKVNRSSVLKTISTVQETLDYLTGQMQDVADETADAYVTAPAGGRVKKIFASAGDSVQNVINANGALALVSLDGCLAVNIDTAAVSKGDSVTVRLPDGTEYPGLVASLVNGTAVITLTDEGTPLGETVSVFAENGTPLGEGELYIHREWRATGYTGTVNRVYAKEEQTVYSGATLFALTDTKDTSAYDLLAQEYEEYAAVSAELFTLYQTGVISAPADGTAADIDEDAAAALKARLTAANPEQETWVLMPLVSRAESYELLLTGDEDPTVTYYVCWITDKLQDGSCIVKEYIYDGVIDDPENSGLLPKKDDFAAATTAALPLPGEVNDVYLYVVSSTGETAAYLLTQFPAEPSPDKPVGPSGPGGGGFSFIYLTPEEEFEKYDKTPVQIATVIPRSTVSVSITVDELDILSVSLGQEAEVTVDAIPGQSFAGTVTALERIGSVNSGGNSKYIAEVTLPYIDKMVPGMNVSVLLPVSERENVLSVPVEALVEQGDKTVVYTGYDEKHGGLINPVEVQTGISDGSFAEILSGLQSGDEIWYAYYDTLPITAQFADFPGDFPQKI